MCVLLTKNNVTMAEYRPCFCCRLFQKMYDKTIVEFSFYELHLSELSNLVSV